MKPTVQKRLWFLAVLVLAGVWPAAPAAADMIFLQDGRTIQADKVEVLPDRVRVERPGETIELPKSAVLSIHVIQTPAPPHVPPPAVYPNFVQQMTDRVRGELGAGVTGPVPR